MIENINRAGDNMKDNISVSILDVNNKETYIDNLINIKEKINDLNIKTGVFDICIHFDIMDSKFVPNTGVNIESISYVKKLGFYIDVHLMVEEPVKEKYVDRAIELGADNITIHYEISNFEKNLNYLIDKKRKLKEKENRDLSIGVSLRPKTKVDVLKKYKSKINRILLMSVEPGFGGQKYIKSTYDKIIFAKNIFPKIDVQVDGGLNEETIPKSIRNGVNSIVIGSYLSKESNTDLLFEKFLLVNVIHTIEKLPRRANMKLDTTTLQVVPGGYGENDILLGINVPDIRKCALMWYKYINLNIIHYFITSKFHDYRRFAIFCLINKVSILYKKVIKDKKDKKSLKELKDIFNFFEDNIEYIKNWDLTDVSGPNILAYNLYIINEKQRKKKIFMYLNNKNFWVKRIGIVSQLNFVRNGLLELPLQVCNYVLYDEFHLYQKATGWVLRELYKKEPKVIVEYLCDKNHEKKLPSILLSYACEKMTKSEKDRIRNEIGE